MRLKDGAPWLLMACIPCIGLVGSSGSRGEERSSEDEGRWVGTVCPDRDESCQPGPIVHVVVKATPGQSGDHLRYQWRATDGAVFDHDSPSTAWRLPPGPGLHFVYVLVSNGKGGYVERRAVVNTDKIGTPLHARPNENRYRAPPAPPVTTGAYRAFSSEPDIPFAIVSTDPNVPYRSPTVLSDVRNRFAISGIPPAAFNSLSLEVAGVGMPLSYSNNNSDRGFNGGTPGVFYPDQPPVSVSFDAEGSYGPIVTTSLGVYGGTTSLLTLADGSSPCGTINDFFGVTVTATASLVFNGVTTGPVRSSLDLVGGISFSPAGTLLLLPNPLPPDPAAVASVSAQCEGASLALTFPLYLPNFGSYRVNGFSAKFENSKPPSVTDIQATMNGRTVGSMVADDTGLPSHDVPSRDAFFTEMGVDSRLAACRYYEAIGAGTCDTRTQILKNAINFETWKRVTGMAPYVREGHQEVAAAFVNRMDLNLARNHHSISYGPDHTAAYVCNGSGPPFTAVDGDANVTTAVANAVSGLDRIACVAMDYMSTPGVNGGAPFTRFIIFGPDGRVLPSINLDGRAEKFVPGVCVACHGGSNYAGHFTEDAHGLPDLGAHFLPYDAGNFLFSSIKGYRREDQEAAIKQLNLIVLNGTGPTMGERNLIQGWYGQDLKATTLNEGYTPVDWDMQEAPDGPIHQTYHQIIAPMCRTCHVALPERFNLDDYYSLLNPQSVLYTPIDPQLIHTHDLCEFYQPMPNSLVTFNRFWTSFGAPTDPSGTTKDLSILWTNFLAANGDQSGSCDYP